jgi:hypothetical protein
MSSELRTAKPYTMALNSSAGELPQGAICGHPAAIFIWLKSKYNRCRINAAVG